MAEIACSQILNKLQTLSDQQASHIRTEGQLTHGTSTNGLRTRDSQALPAKTGRYAESRIPAGVSDKADGDHAPSKQLSLFWHYRWRISKARVSADVGQLLRLAGEATRDYEEHTGKRKPLRFTDTGPGEGQSAHAHAVSHLLSHFPGVSAEKAAIEMKTPSESFRDALKWVRSQRVRNGCDPEFGEARMSDERTRKIVSMSEQGMKQQTIADELGLSRQRVSQILAGK